MEFALKLCLTVFLMSIHLSVFVLNERKKIIDIHNDEITYRKKMKALYTQ